MRILWLDRQLRLQDNPSLALALRTPGPIILLACPWQASNPESQWLPQASGLSLEAWLRAALDLQQQLAKLGQCLNISLEPAQQLIPRLLPPNQSCLLLTDAQYDQQKTQWLAKLPCQTPLPCSIQCLGDNQLLSPEQTRGGAKHIGRFTAFYYLQNQEPLKPELDLHPESIQAQSIDLHWPTKSCRQDWQQPISSSDYQPWLEQYLWHKQQVRHYKQSRNAFLGLGNYSGMSVGLSLGSLSVRHLYQQIRAHEQQLGSNESTQALIYELYWRHYFHWLARQLQARLYAKTPELSPRQASLLQHWCLAQTKHPLINAIQHQLQQTGFISNRARQITASYLVHDLGLPWQYGAVWFEQQLLDYDPASNYGNWAYIAGHHPASQKPHVFDINRQQQRYDPKSEFIRQWQHG